MRCKPTKQKRDTLKLTWPPAMESTANLAMGREAGFQHCERYHKPTSMIQLRLSIAWWLRMRTSTSENYPSVLSAAVNTSATLSLWRSTDLLTFETFGYGPLSF